ncbi:MAG: threonine synthase, partial [Clostridiales bacterium]|nr:threonine synthase [Clostridiales bacterium]
MAFVSTRGGEAVSASAAILRGIAPDGGLYVPETLPVLTGDEIRSLADLPYAERAAKVLDLILDDYSADELLSFAKQAYSSFECEEVAPIREIKGNTHVMELFH